MTIQISISGHANGDDEAAQKENEHQFIEHLRSVVRSFQEDGNEVYSATFSSQHHQTGDLK